MNTISEMDPRLAYIDLSELLRNPEDSSRYLFACLKNRYWIIHETRGAVFWRTAEHGGLVPQCSAEEALAKHLKALMYPWSVVRFIPAAYISQIDPRIDAN